MLVPFIGPLCTASCELVGAAKAGALNEGMGLLCEDVIKDLDVGEEEGATFELAAIDDEGAGAGVGVKKDVDRIVSAACVANGSPLGLRNVIAGMTWVMTVRWMGSITRAVFALACCPTEDDC